LGQIPHQTSFAVLSSNIISAFETFIELSKYQN